MIIVDNALRKREEEGRPIRVGMIGAGFMAQGLANQILNSVPGMDMTAVYGRRVERAVDVFRYAEREDPVVASTQDELEDAVRAGRPVVTDDAYLLARSEQIDALVDVTGSVEFGARVALEAFSHGKHVVLVNAELDSLLGPILKTKADSAGVVVTHTDGDEPGVAMTLLRYLRSLGLRPVAAGNIKGMLDEAARHCREDIGKIEEPKAQALFETTAEVLKGLITAYDHYERGSEKGMRR